MKARTSSAVAKPPRWLSSGAQDEFGVRQKVDGCLRVAQGNDVVGVAVPPPHRRGNVGKPEAPVASEESRVVDDGLEAALGE